MMAMVAAQGRVTGSGRPRRDAPSPPRFTGVHKPWLQQHSSIHAQAQAPGPRQSSQAERRLPDARGRRFEVMSSALLAVVGANVHALGDTDEQKRALNTRSRGEAESAMNTDGFRIQVRLQGIGHERHKWAGEPAA